MSVTLTCALLLAGATGIVRAAPLSADQVSQFLSSPSTILASNQNGGAQLVATVRDLILSDPNPPAVLNAIVALLASANGDQQSAIGTGLGQAAQASVRTNPGLATQIQEALAASGVQPAITAYAAVTGNTVTAATGGGDAGGGGGGGSSGGGGPTTGGAPSGERAVAVAPVVGGTTATANAGGEPGGGGGVSNGGGLTGRTSSASPSPGSVSP